MTTLCAASRRAAGAPRILWVVAAAMTLGGCLFHDAPAPRYFAPPSALGTADDPLAAPAPAPIFVRLRNLQAASYLGEQIAWRVSDVERGLYEQRRWTEFPSRYVNRAMVQALDRTPGVRRVESGRVPTLDLELIAFDEVLAPTHEADVEVVASLRDADQAAIFERAFVARRAVPDADPASVARAMGGALDEVVTEIAAQVAAQAPRPTPGRAH
jgi:ABC-type uncharacterized transport system auxiliary subunit